MIKNKSKNSLFFSILPVLLQGLFFSRLLVAEQIRNDRKDSGAPQSAVLNGIPVKPEKNIQHHMFFNACEECMKDDRHWYYTISEIKAVVDRCGADYLLIRYDRKFMDKDCEIISRFNFSSRKSRMELDSIELVQRWKNGDKKNSRL
jgi:hypothetical protein